MDLEAIKARERAATPGPWLPSGYGWNIVSAGEDGVSVSTRAPQTYLDGTDYDPRADAQFIAHAREDVPALVAEVERLREIVECGCYGGQVTIGWDQWRPCPDCTPLRAQLKADDAHPAGLAPTLGGPTPHS